MKIVNTYTGTAYSATLGADATWTASNLGSAAWTNSTTDAGTYADITLSADAVLSADAGIVTDGIVVSGGHTLTLANGASGSLTLSGPATLRASAGATLAFDTTQISRAEGVSSVTLAGSGTIAFTDADGAAAYNKIGTDFTASSNTTVKILGNANFGTDALSVSSGIREFAGGLTAGAVNLTGGLLKISGGTLSGTPNISFVKGGNLQFSKADGSDSATYSVGEIGMKDFSNSSTEITIDSGVTVNATAFNNGWGMKSLTVNGALDVSSGTVAMGSGNVTATISGTGEISAGTFNFGNVGKYNFSGVTLNVGDGGITHTNAWGYSLSLGAMTVRATAGFSIAANSGGDGTGTTNLTDASTGTTFDTNGFNVAANTGFGGAGKLVKAGEGTLALNQASTYSGGTVVEAGTLVAGNATALGSGLVTVKSGATLARGIDGTVNVGSGGLTTESGAILDLGALSTESAAIAVTGNVSLASGTIFDLDSIVEGGKLISGTGLSAEGWSLANIYVGGKLINQRGSATFTVTDGVLVLSSYTAGGVLDITWAGGETGVWKENGSGWTKDSAAQTFQQGDSVTFGSDATMKNVSVVGALNTGTIEVNDNYTFAFADGASVSGTALTVADGLTLTLSGTGTLAVAGHSATGSVALGAGTAYAIDASAAPSDFSLANVSGDAASTISISASSDSGENNVYHFTTISGMNSEFLGSLKVTGGFLNLGEPSAVNGSGVKEIVLSGGIGNTSTTGSGLCFMGGDTSLSFSKNIVAEGDGGVLRSHASASNVVEFTGSVTGTTIRHSDGGTHKFSGTVNLEKFVQGGATDGQTVTEFAGTTTLGTLELATGTATFSSANATITTANVSGGTMNLNGNTTLGTLSNTNGAETDPVGGTVNLGGTATGTTTLAANAGTLNIGSTWNLTSGVVLGGTINIDGGTLTLTGNDTNHTATFYVKAGGTLKATGHDSFRYNDATGGIVMTGAEGNLAKFIVADKDSNGAASLTLSKNITLKGYTEISSEGGSSFNSFGGKITATGTNNTVSSAIQLRKEFTVEVTGADDALLFSGTLSDTGNAYSGDVPKTMVKTGDGKLTLSGDNSNWTGGATISQGTLVVEHENALGRLTAQVLNANSEVVKTPAKITVEDGAKLQISTSNVNLGTAEGTGVVLEQGAKLVIDYANLTETAESTATEKTFEIMTAAVFSIYGNTLSAGEVTDDMNGAWELLGGDSAWLESAKWTLADNTLSLTLTIPEPSVFGLLAGLGALALAGTRRRRKKA